MADLHKLTVQEAMNAGGAGGVWTVNTALAMASVTTKTDTLHTDVSGVSVVKVVSVSIVIATTIPSVIPVIDVPSAYVDPNWPNPKFSASCTVYSCNPFPAMFFSFRVYPKHWLCVNGLVY